MSAAFPPIPVYPLAIDSDTTLYLVYNTTESTISADNPPWSEEVLIEPQEALSPEIWPDNGFATISGELFYYGSVEKNGDDRVFKLKRCARNLGGDASIYNVEGTDIRGFVVAEHHNQLADAVGKVEGFIGIQDSTDADSLDFRIRQLADQSECFDDGNCPNVNFSFRTVTTDPCDGTLIDYELLVLGNFNSFRLDFGDGTFTNSTQPGEHRYAPNTTVDPVVFVSNNFCQLVVTAVLRTEDKQPTVPVDPNPLTFPVPSIPPIPTITITPTEIPPLDITIPPIVLPCPEVGTGVSIGPISIGDISVPSFITVSPIPSFISVIAPSFTPISISPEIPSVISISPPVISISPEIPSVISFNATVPSTISLTGIEIPSVISFDAVIPSIITVDANIPSFISTSIPDTILVVDSIPNTIAVIDSIPNTIIVIDSIPSVITITPPSMSPISVNWGTPPTISCNCNVGCGCCSYTGPAPPMAGALWTEDFDPGLGTVEVDYDFAGIPSRIIVEAPEIPAISICADSLPSEIKLIAPDIPSEIKVTGLDKPVELRLIAPEFPQIEISSKGLPKSISIDASSMPTEITIVPPKIPSVISIDASGIPSTIQVEGMPKTIQVVGIPDFIPMSIMNPEVEMIYRGAPIDVVVKLDLQNITGQNGEGGPCVMLVPCPAR